MLAAASAGQADGIRDYTTRLLHQLRTVDGIAVSLHIREGGGAWRPASSSAPDGQDVKLEDADTILLQYNPFWYGRRGFAPGLILAVWRLRRGPARPTIALMVHEAFVDMKNWRWFLMGAWQRLQLLALQGLADVQLASCESWGEWLQRWRPGRPVHHLPVGSNFPDMRAHRAAGRRALAVSDDTLVLTCFGLHHTGRLADYVTRSAEASSRSGHPALILNLGTISTADESEPDGGGPAIYSPGYLDPSETAELLAAADLFLAPYADGVSTRRTTVMSALQHQIPVVGTSGHLTDRVLLRSDRALHLVPVGERERFTEAVARLAANPERRRELGRAGRELYEERFDWPVIAATLLEILRSR